jgi:GntR family transcriptional regulator
MKLKLDFESPVPLYHQIAEAIRYRVATGSLAPGAPLPPLREAAGLWGVNLHTARRAYAELARDRLVETRPQAGTRVVARPHHSVSATRSVAAAEFLAGVVREARERHGLTLDQLVAALENVGAAASVGVVYVVECSETQSTDLARQLEARWRVDARPWSLEWQDAPPPGPVVATYFHYNDVRSRWPARLASVRFVAIRPDPSLADRLAEGRAGDRPIGVTLCEREPAMAANIAADLSSILPADRFRIARRLADEPKALLDRRGGGPVLFSPRVWGELGPAERANPRAVEVRYVFDPAELEALGTELGWPSR